MAADNLEKAFVFLDTNIDTHICIAPPLDSTVREVKKLIEESHLSIFPEKGEMKVTGLLMKYEQHFYMLANCVIMRSIFPEVKKPWYLRVEMKPITTHHSPQHPSHLTNHLDLIPFNLVEQQEPTLVDDTAVKEPTTTAPSPSKRHSSTKTLKGQLKSLSKHPGKSSKRKKKSLPHVDELASKTSGSKKRTSIEASSVVSPLKVSTAAVDESLRKGYVSDSDV